MSTDALPSTQQLDQALGARVAALSTPALVIDRSAAVHNIQAMLKRLAAMDASPRRWRPHIKTVKQAPLVAALFDAGITRLKCATALEAKLAIDVAQRMRVELDLLVAYPLCAPAVDAVLELRRRAPSSIQISLLADAPAHALELDTQCARAGVPMGVFYDVDLGMNRTGQTPRAWLEAENLVPAFEALTLRGLHGYDGHHTWDQREAAHEAYDELIGLANGLASGLAQAPELVTSGTHSYAHALVHAGLNAGDAAGVFEHSVSPGTIVLSDRRSASATLDLGLRQAAFVATRVVSVAGERITLDAGSKGLAPDTAAQDLLVLGHPDLQGERRSEEHLVCAPLSASATTEPAPQRGDLLWIVPEHVCTTVNMYREAVHLLDDGSIETVPVVAASRLPWGLPT